jgi:hypothetical protein
MNHLNPKERLDRLKTINKIMEMKAKRENVERDEDKIMEVTRINDLLSDRDYADMRNGLIVPSKNFLYTDKHIDLVREEFIEQGYAEISSIDEMKNTDFISKKGRYILKNGKVRMGGRITSMDEGFNFIYFRPFFPSNVFSDGWSVQFDNILYLYVAQVKRRKKLTTEEDKEKAIAYLKEVTSQNNIKNAYNLFNFFKTNNRDEYKQYMLTKPFIYNSKNVIFPKKEGVKKRIRKLKKNIE